MTRSLEHLGSATLNRDINQALMTACERIAPSWPLDRMIAVNPYWERRDQSFADVAADLHRLIGTRLAMPLNYYRRLWMDNRITEVQLEQARDELDSYIPMSYLLSALEWRTDARQPAPLLCDVLDAQRDLQHQPSWCDSITHQVSQYCAAAFDEQQADWQPTLNRVLYADWLQIMRNDHSMALLMNSHSLPKGVRALPESPMRLISEALVGLSIPTEHWADYLQAVLLRIGGWASWGAYRRWQARLNKQDDDTVEQLVAIRLAWEWLLDDGQRKHGSNWHRWQQSWYKHQRQAWPNAHNVALIWQRAHELAYQRDLMELLSQAPTPAPADAPDVQAVFCIDVRSEVFRRHLESQSEGIQTLGFAGFFGLPLSYRSIGTQVSRPQLPGLLAPVIEITDSTGQAAQDDTIRCQRQTAMQRLRQWQPFQSVPASSFTLVETLGLGYATKLIKRNLGWQTDQSDPSHIGLSDQARAQLVPDLLQALSGDVSAQVDLAEQVLSGMNLKSGFARLVLLAGHGSETQNNPQRAGLDCGACCGQTGEVNARSLAGLLNDSAVRQGLQARGIALTGQTWFVAGLHNTTTDDIQLYDVQAVPESHRDDIRRLQNQLDTAGTLARQERAPSLSLGALVDDPEKLADSVRRRARDWSETRPEWGLANNAAFIVASRSRTRGLNLQGRSFLHDYDPDCDADGSILTGILTAPMVVTNWINMQYFASTVDNLRYGSGNKTLHNVVGGHIGVFEGNGGDLRTGLALQSVHDGTDWQHEPLRLTVLVDAPRTRIEAVMAGHEVVRQLVDHQWLYLGRFTERGVEFYREGDWSPQV